MKQCTKCGKEKPPDAFKRDRAKADGLYPSCKECVAAYRQTKADRIREYNAAYRAANLDYYLSYNRAYYWADPRAACERARQYRAQNPHVLREWRKRNSVRNLEVACRWRERNPERVRANQRRHLARRLGLKLALPDAFTESEFQSKYEAYQGRCHWCGQPVAYDDVHRDHLIALTKGGANDIGNIVPSCAPCNLRKSNKLPWEFAEGRLL